MHGCVIEFKRVVGAMEFFASVVGAMEFVWLQDWQCRQSLARRGVLRPLVRRRMMEYNIGMRCESILGSGVLWRLLGVDACAASQIRRCSHVMLVEDARVFTHYGRSQSEARQANKRHLTHFYVSSVSQVHSL